jgi:hypothetical protein
LDKTFKYWSHDFLGALDFPVFCFKFTLIAQRFPLFSLQGMPKKVSCGT